MDTPPPDLPDTPERAREHVADHDDHARILRADACRTAAAYDDLGDLYDEWVQSVVEDIPFYTHVARMSAPDGTARILELGSGSGRVTLPLLARGHHVTAVDVAGIQLERLQARAAHDQLDMRLRTMHADLRDALTQLCDTGFDAVIAPFRCLLHVADDAEAIFRDSVHALRPGGLIAFDVFHPPPGTEAALAASWQLRRRVDMPDGAWSIWERAAADAAHQSLRLDVRCDGPHGTTRSSSMTLHTPPPYHWRDALEAAGVSIMSAWSWFDGEPFDLSAPDSVWLGQVPER